MTANDIIRDARVAHVRELKAEVARLNAELVRTRDELASLRGHLDQALLAVRDAETIPEGGTFLIVDGWNALLGSHSILSSGEKHLPLDGKSDALRARVRAWLAASVHLNDRAWIVLDGPRPGGETEERLRVSWTGGSGAHRADRFICDYLRMRRFAGPRGNVVVATDDRDFKREAERLGAVVVGSEALALP
ncbi:MAG: hypothetical protein ACI4Q3_07590 [Kiritimatiellia bacterium]